jgi:hypothetical protein
MKKVFPEKVVNLVIIAEFNVTPLKMVDPITACILNIEGKTPLHYVTFHFAYTCIR